MRRLRGTAPEDATAALLRKALRDRANLVVAESAKLVADLRLSSLLPDLLAAFDRLFQDPVKTDPKCWAKTAIVKALTELEHCESAPFLRGFEHIQMEPVWGGKEDSAVQLRANSILGLVQCADLTRSEVLRKLVDAMMDAADPVRLEAVRAIEQMNGDEAVLLLRMKARFGDQRPVVIGHVFDALLRLERGRGAEFVAEHLKSGAPEVRDEAALALGASRLPEAVKVLIETWNQPRDREFGSVLLRALSSSRQPSAIDFLIELVRSGISSDSALAVDALKIHDDSPEIRAAADQAKRERVISSKNAL